MKLFSIYLAFCCIIQLSCNNISKKEVYGKVLVEYIKNMDNDKFLIRKYPNQNTGLPDTVVLRFMNGFINESVIIYSNNKIYKELFNVATDQSIAYSTSLEVPLNNLEVLIVEIRKIKYAIPVAKGFLFLDLFIDGRNIITAKYNNNILILS